MAQKVIATLIDDIDGSEAQESVRFGLDGVDFDIDLSAKHAERLREALAEYVAAARRVGGRKLKSAVGTPKPSHDLDLTLVREWARSQGLPVSDRGRVANDIIEGYKQAQEKGSDASADGADASPKRPRPKRRK